MFHVYFIQAGDFIKIGIAKDVSCRLDALQTGNHRKLKLLKTIEMPSYQIALDVERTLHKLFKKDRVHREWFENSYFIQELLTLLEINNYEELRENILLAINALEIFSGDDRFGGVDLASETILYGDGGFHLSSTVYHGDGKTYNPPKDNEN